MGLTTTLSPAADEAAVGEEGPTVTIDPTKDLWFNIAANVKESNTEQTETNLLIVGGSGSGKTTLLHRVYSSLGGSGGGSGNKKVKPTTALDYSFARRNERNISQVAHFWELAQGTELAQLSEVVITPENIHAVVVAVVVDASEEGLGTAWETATYWLKRIDTRVQEILQKMKAKGSSTPVKMLGRAQNLVGADHPDLPKLRLSGVPTVVVVNKLDEYRGDTTTMKLLSRSMRYLAHLYGAHLIFTCDQESHKWRALMSHILFQAPFDSKYLEFDPERGGVLITADRDSFLDIGEPNVVSFSTSHKSTGDTELDRWKLPFDQAFPPQTVQTGQPTNDPFLKKLYDTSEGGYGEAAIDALRKQKDEELEQYRKSNKVKTKVEKSREKDKE